MEKPQRVVDMKIRKFKVCYDCAKVLRECEHLKVSEEGEYASSFICTRCKNLEDEYFVVKDEGDGW